MPVTVKDFPRQVRMGSVGVDLSQGICYHIKRWQADIKQTQKWAEKLAAAQRAKNKQRVKAIRQNQLRLDAIHKFTTKLVKDNALIVVGVIKSVIHKKTQPS